MREPFRTLRGVAAPLPVANINTDAIIPSEHLRSPDADLARGLFGRLRFDESGAERPGFVLNRPKFRGARILVAGANFGCGSSREAAVWALQRFGIGCVVAPSFADIFYENAMRNGLLAAVVDADFAARLASALETDEPTVDVDLASSRIVHGNRESAQFTIDAFRREALMRGDDEIALTLRHAGEIAAHHERMVAARGWMNRSIIAGQPAAREKGGKE